MKRTQVRKHRAKWPRHPAQEVHDDTRTKRQRTRADEVRAALEQEIQELDDLIDRH